MPVVITFVSQKGGVGKSTLARSVAIALARAKIKVLLADCDAQQTTAAQWNRLRDERRRSPVIALVTKETVSEALDDAKSFEALVIDMPGRVSRDTLDIARQSHVVVQPTGPTLDDLHPSVLLFHELAAAGIPKRRLLFALCRTLAKGEGDAAREYLLRAGYEVALGSLPEKLGYRQALNDGASAIETDDKTLNIQAGALVDAILKKVNEEVDNLAREKAAGSTKEGKRTG